MSTDLLSTPPQADALLAEFPPIEYATWKKKAETDLKGAPFEKKLLTKLPEGITLQPIYTAVDAADATAANSLPGFAPFLRGSSAAVHNHCLLYTSPSPRD